MGNSLHRQRCYSYNELCDAYREYKQTKKMPKFKYKSKQTKTKIKFLFIGNTIRVTGRINDMEFYSLTELSENYVLRHDIGFISNGECTYGKNKFRCELEITYEYINFVVYSKQRYSNTVIESNLVSINMRNRNYD